MKITKFPVLIISPARCGSTALLKQLVLKYNLLEFSEPSIKKDPKLLLQLYKFLYLEKRYDLAIKVLSSELDYYNFKLNDFFTIRLKRRNILDQCASYYLARARKKWHYFANESIEQDIITIDRDQIKICIIHSLPYSLITIT